VATRATALVVAVASVLLFAAVSSPRAPEATAKPTGATTFKCNQHAIKTYIEVKRKATWRWQDKILVPRTRSSYQDKRSRGCAYLHWISNLWQGRAQSAFQTWVDLRDPEEAICHVFGVYCSEALSVSWCESRYHITAHNGQYLGLFQMGSSERALYGHGYTALEQAVAAYHYFVSSGRNWSPWSCQPT
jgi:hypothetical protein